MANEKHQIVLSELKELKSELIGTNISWMLFKKSNQDFDSEKSEIVRAAINEHHLGMMMRHTQDVLLYDAVMRLCRMNQTNADCVTLSSLFSTCRELIGDDDNLNQWKALNSRKAKLQSCDWLKEARDFRDSYLGHKLRDPRVTEGPFYSGIDNLIDELSELINGVAKIVHDNQLPENWREGTTQLLADKFWACFKLGLFSGPPS